MWPPTKSRFEFPWKDTITLLGVLVAIGTSLFSVYVSVFRGIDKVRVIVDEIEPMVGRAASGKAVLITDVIVTFINAGTRYAVVRDITAVIQQANLSDTVSRRTSCTDTEVGYDLDFEPSVLRPGEIVTKRVKVKEGLYDRIFEVEDGTEVFVSCLRFKTINPDDDEIKGDVSLASEDAGSLQQIWINEEPQPITIMEGRSWRRR